ncbi:MAG: hypothetical protein ACFFA3_12485 [Promethearchaeota archaeon]
MIILTGFGPYQSYRDNVSGLIVQEFESNNFELKIRKEILPVSWKSSIRLYKRVLQNSNMVPKCVILMGIQSSKHYSLECISWNFAFGKDIDNNFKFGVIKYKLNLLLKTSLDISSLYSKLRNRMELKLSYLPGFYLCNYIYYLALSISKYQYPVIFIHIPHKESIKRGIKAVNQIIKSTISIL